MKRTCLIILKLSENFLLHSGDSLVLFPLLLIIVFFGSKNYSLIALHLLITITIAGMVVWLFKMLTKKARPKGNKGYLYRRYDPYSFPSGHAARAWAIYTVLAFSGFFPALFFFIWAILISYIRVKVKLHYFVDIIAGALVGIVTALLFLYLNSKHPIMFF